MTHSNHNEKKEYKSILERRKLIRCGLCKYNRGENAKRRGKSDRYKAISRISIRRMPVVWWLG